MVRVLVTFTITLLCNICGYQGRNVHLFQVTPKNVSIYYNTARRFSQICAPPVSDKTMLLEWQKDGIRILHQNDDRINIKEITEKSILEALRVANGSVVSQLSINNVLASDSGEYSCIATNGSIIFVAKFVVNVTGDCRNDSFKCEKDKKCIMSYSLCDGVAQCSDSFDESTDVGCPLPPAPSQVEIDYVTTNTATIKWQAIPKATGYESFMEYPGNKTELFKTDPGNAMVTMNGLEANTVYTIRVRTVTLTGYGNYTEPILFRTKKLAVVDTPQNLQSTMVTISEIRIQWAKIKDANSYEIVTTTPTGDTISQYTTGTKSNYLFTNLVSDKSYRFKVRARSASGYGNFSEELVVKTLVLDAPGPPSNVKQTPQLELHGVDLAWDPAEIIGNTHRDDILYRVEYCALQRFMELKKAYRQVTLDVKPDNDNISDKNGETTSKNDNVKKSVVVKQSYIAKEWNYQKIQCRKSAFTRKTTIRLKSLAPGYYWYSVTTFGARKTKGNSTEGNFSIKMYTTAPPTSTPTQAVAKVNNGLVVFGICSGGLIVILIIAFLLAWACKWQALMDAVKEYRAFSEVKEAEPSNKSNNQHFVANDRYVKV